MKIYYVGTILGLSLCCLSLGVHLADMIHGEWKFYSRDAPLFILALIGVIVFMIKLFNWLKS